MKNTISINDLLNDFHSHFDYFPAILEVMETEQDERFRSRY